MDKCSCPEFKFQFWIQVTEKESVTYQWSKTAKITELEAGLGWKDLGGSSCHKPLLKQGQLQLVAQEHIQIIFEFLLGRMLFNLLSLFLFEEGNSPTFWLAEIYKDLKKKKN